MTTIMTMVEKSQSPEKVRDRKRLQNASMADAAQMKKDYDYDDGVRDGDCIRP